MIDFERLLRVPFIDVEGGFDVSPDGIRLAFAWNGTGQWEVYELDLIAPDSPRLVTDGPGGKFAPKYSPDGSCLAYVVDFDGGENFHIFIRPCHSEPSEESPARDLTPDIDFAIQPNFCWSPDSTQIAFLADKTGCFGAYVIPSNGGQMWLLLENGFPAWDVTWSPNGSYLAVMFEATGQDYHVSIIPVDGNEPFYVAKENGPINAWNPAWSPDSTKLAFHSDIPNGFHQIGIFDLSTQKISWLTGGESNCRTPSWSKGGAQLSYISAQGGTDKVVIHSLTGEMRSYQVETGVHYHPKLMSDGKGVATIFNNPRHPPDLWMLAPESGEFHQLTHSLRSSDFATLAPHASAGEHSVRVNRYLTAEAVTTESILPEEIIYPGMDGTPIPALLFKPDHAYENTPAVVVIHGGPNWHFQVEWHPLMIHLASCGWTVLAPNYRGSTGYGIDWQMSNRFKLGSIDTDDVAAGVHFLLENNLADPKHIAVTGRSHGGYLTMSCLTRFPNLWCAGSAVVPFLNWFTAHENSREDLQHWDLQNFGNPKDNYELWYQASPFFFLDQVQSPVQLICGENDPRCPASESTQARDRLLELGKEVDFHLYLGEGHTLLKTENVVDAEVRRVNFLAKALE